MTKPALPTTAKPGQVSQPPSQQPCLPVPKHRSINEYVRESQLLLWLWRVISEISYSYQYEQYLRDGVILCQLIDTLAPSGGQPRTLTGGENKQVKRENIQRFLDSCRAYGLDDDELFEVEDLLSMQDIPRVTKCLFALGKHAAEKFGDPVLGKMYDVWLEEKLRGPDAPESATRRAGMPIGDDLFLSHVNTTWLKERLEKRRAAAAAAIKRPPREPLVERTPSKFSFGQLKNMFSEENRPVGPAKTGPPPMVSLV